MSEMDPVLSAQGVTKSFGDGVSRVRVLQGLDFAVSAGESVAVLGRSGSGKSTLLHVLAGLDDADAGEVTLAGQSVTAASVSGRAALRNRYLGFVYQMHHLLPEFTALENVAMPLLIGDASVADASSRAEFLLDRVDLSLRLHHRPDELSGGERQRVALARALAPSPAVVLADEPTGNLDRENADRVMALFDALRREEGSAVVIVTHDSAIAERTDRTVEMIEGRILAAS